jgi:hypothetical protein
MSGMKSLSKFILLTVLAVSFMTVACDDMNSIIQDDLDRGEAIYPGKPGYVRPVDDVFAGIGRAWIYWGLGSDSRVVKSVISYTYSGETTTIEKTAPEIGDNYYDYRADSLEITGLAEGYYTFSVYTVDSDGHRSISTSLYPQIVQIYGETHLNALSPRSIDKMDMQTGGDLKITWTKDTTNLLYSVVKYYDHSESAMGITQIDTIPNKEVETVLTGFKRFKNFLVTSYYQVGIDVAQAEDFYAPPVIEKVLLATAPNGFAELTTEAAMAVTELTYPFGMESWTLQDLYYFPNLRTLDLTPGTQTLSELKYARHYTELNKLGNGGAGSIDTVLTVTNTVGGGPWLNFVSGYMTDENIATINDLLESGQLTKVKYTRNSYPGLDPVLEKHGGKIEWSPVNPPDDVMIPKNLLSDYRLEDSGRGNVEVSHSDDESVVPDDIAGKFAGELKNVYKVVLNQYGNQQVSNTAVFSLPEGVRFNSKEYKYLKFDVYIEVAGDSILLDSRYSKYGGFKNIQIIRKTRFDNFPATSPYPSRVNGDRNEDFTYSKQPDDPDDPDDGTPLGLSDAELGSWKSLTVDMSNDPVVLGLSVAYHSRILILKFGLDSPWLPDYAKGLTYYVANLRWSKSK